MSEYLLTISGASPSEKLYLAADKALYLDMLATKPDQVRDVCWTGERDDAMAFSEREIEELLHGVEAVLMVPDQNMRWEVK